jgi:hypothetical protein
MGYLFIIDNPANGVKELIGKKNILFYSYDSLTVNSKINGLLLALDWYDNCPNGGSISSLQSPILFSIKQLHDYTCTKKIRFNSTLNIGCAADGYIGCIIVKKNTPLYFNKISLDSTSQKFKILYLNIEFNKSFCTSMSVSSLASTSNTREIKLSDYYKSSIPPDLHDISMENETKINLEYSISPEKSVLLQYGDQNISSWGSTFVISRETNTTNFTYHLSNTSRKITDFSLIRYNCGNKIIDMGNHTSNIYLTNENLLFTFNEQTHIKIQSFVFDCLIRKKFDSVPHTIGHTPSSFYDFPGFDLSLVRIKAETKNGLNWCQSKTIFVDMVFNYPDNGKTLIQSAFTLKENTLEFSKSNRKNKIGKSTSCTLNRLGESINKVDSLVKWNVKFSEEQLDSVIYTNLVEQKFRIKLKNTNTV